jgi:hypothetical protein
MREYRPVPDPHGIRQWSLPLSPPIDDDERRMLKEGACVNLPPESKRLFWSTDPVEVNEAKKICGFCPAFVPCRRTADRIERFYHLYRNYQVGHQVWAGETGEERARRRRAGRRR